MFPLPGRDWQGNIPVIPELTGRPGRILESLGAQARSRLVRRSGCIQEMFVACGKCQNCAGISGRDECLRFWHDIRPFPGVQNFFKKVKKRLVSPQNLP